MLSLIGAFKPAAIVCALAATGLLGTWVVHCHFVDVDAAGRPMDWAGDGLKCPECSGPLRYLRGHRYRCRQCGLDAHARTIGTRIDVAVP